MSMTIDLPQCLEQRRGGEEAKNVSLRGEAGADKNEGGRGGGERNLPAQQNVSLMKDTLMMECVNDCFRSDST